MFYDWRVQVAHRMHKTASNEATNLALIEINDGTIREVKSDNDLGFLYGLYWPRDVYAAGLKELTDQGAKAVAFDVLFAEERGDQGSVATSDGRLVLRDDIFAEQLRTSTNGILAAADGQMPALKFLTNASHVASMSVDRDTIDGVLRQDRAFQDFYVWHFAIQQLASSINCDLARTIDDRVAHKITFFSVLNDEKYDFPTDQDGMIATTNLLKTIPEGFPDRFAPYKKARVWSMGIVLAAMQMGLDLDHPILEPGKITLRGSNNVERTIPVDANNSYYIDWSLTPNSDQITRSAYEYVLADFVNRSHHDVVSNVYRDKLVVIGSTATGNDLTDKGSTPLESDTFLVIKHLNVANSIISGTFVHPTATAFNLALIVAVGLFSAWLTWVVEKAHHGSILMIVFALLYVGVALLAYTQWRVWMPIVLPMLCAGGVTHVGTLVYRVRFEQSQKRLIKQLFSRVLSPDVVNDVLKAEEIRISGQRREITVYFADVRGFTELTDVTQVQAEAYVKEHNLVGAEAEAYFDMRAKGTLETVNAYLAVISDVVKLNKGTLDKYIGDCVMAFWGAPLVDPQHAVQAVKAGIGAQRAMAALNEERSKINKQRETENIELAKQGLPILAPLPLLSMGTGINTGVATVGFMGSDSHLLNYTAFGRDVNLASRLEGVSGHGRIIIGEATYAALERDAPELAKQCLEWPPQNVKGFRTAVRIYEVIWQEGADISTMKRPVPQPAAKTAAPDVAKK